MKADGRTQDAGANKAAGCAEGSTARERALRMICPRCKARPGDPCVGTRGERKAAHVQRHQAYRRWHRV